MQTRHRRYRWQAALAVCMLLVGGAQAAAREGAAQRGVSQCASTVLAGISAGPGSPGAFEVETQEIGFAASKTPVTVFLPKDDGRTRRPVVFFSHGYGPNIWSVYEPLLRHVASRGNIVVFGVFPLGMATMKTRYETLWAGYEAAVQKLAARIDLTRVGFVGHSFGGGANPTLAYVGIVEKGWGSRGAFLFELAPWYTYGMSDEKFARFPKHVLHAVQVYEHDTMNDHAMAYDLYRQFNAPLNWLLLVRSREVQGCNIIAEHMLPARARNATVLQYAVLRPLDVLMQASFEGGDPTAMAQALRPAPAAYQPVEIVPAPPSSAPAGKYRFPWAGRMNPRLPGGGNTRAQFEDMSPGHELSTDNAQSGTERPGLLERWRERRAN